MKTIAHMTTAVLFVTYVCGSHDIHRHPSRLKNSMALSISMGQANPARQARSAGHSGSSGQQGSSGSHNPVVQPRPAAQPNSVVQPNPAVQTNPAVQSGPPVVSYPVSKPASDTGGHTPAEEFLKYCRKFCRSNPCPAECTQSFLDPWSLRKRSASYGGLTFDDYLFMKWLGRDMIREGMKR